MIRRTWVLIRWFFFWLVYPVRWVLTGRITKRRKPRASDIAGSWLSAVFHALGAAVVTAAVDPIAGLVWAALAGPALSARIAAPSHAARSTAGWDVLVYLPGWRLARWALVLAVLVPFLGFVPGLMETPAVWVPVSGPLVLLVLPAVAAVFFRARVRGGTKKVRSIRSARRNPRVPEMCSALPGTAFLLTSRSP